MKEEILKFFKGEADDSAETLQKYSRDASIFEVVPKLVLYPQDKEDVRNLVQWVSQNKTLYDHPGNSGASISITARCAGTDMSGGALGESIILDFTRHMNRLIGGPLPLENGISNGRSAVRPGGYPPTPSAITVEPGMLYRDFERITLGKGLILPCYTSSKNLNAIGGMFGNNSAGERTLKYGQMEAYVLSSRVVFADGNEYEVRPLTRAELDTKMAQGDFEGNIYKSVFELIRDNAAEIADAKPNVSKNSAGYYIWNVLKGNIDDNFIFDLNKLLVGSQGTLGIVTEITVKVIPEHKHSRLVAVPMHDLEPLGRVVDEILSLDPDTLETYDDKSLRLAVRYVADFLKRKRPGEWLPFLRAFMPEFRMMLAGTFPKLVILAEFRGNDERELEKKSRELEKLLEDYRLRVHVTKEGAEANKYWDIRRENFALLRNHMKGLRSAPFIDDVIVRPEFLPKFLPELKDLMARYRLPYAIAGHAGDGNFHIFPMLDFKRLDTGKIILELGGKVFDLVARYRGSFAAEHNDGLIRTAYLPGMYGDRAISIFRKIKIIFDAENVFNPGKKVPLGDRGGGLPAQAGTKRYIASHIAREHHFTHHKV